MKASVEDLRAIIESPKVVRFWGREYTIRPCLISDLIGDGGRLLVLEPLATRPNYYVVRVDSAFDIDDSDVDMEAVYQAIEEEHGSIDDEWDEDDGVEPEGWFKGWPALNLSCGVTWGEINWPDVALREGSPT